MQFTPTEQRGSRMGMRKLFTRAAARAAAPFPEATPPLHEVQAGFPGQSLVVHVVLFALTWWLWGRALQACKARLGLKPRAPNWQVYAVLFPSLFPQVVAFIWSCVGCLPCEVLIRLHGYGNPWSKKAVWNFRYQEGAQGKVALTIDDAPGRPNGIPLLKEVLEVLDEYNATASFFVVTTFSEQREEMLREMVERGHEICNHGGKDIKYHRHSKEAFTEVLMECEAKINTCLHQVNAASPAQADTINRRNNLWFRPPQAAMSEAMVEVLEEKGFRIAMSDCYGMDVMCRPPFIANYTASHARPGSIVLLHMPEVGFREYNLESLRKSLAGLQARGLQCVSLSQLEATCKGTDSCSPRPNTSDKQSKAF